MLSNAMLMQDDESPLSRLLTNIDLDSIPSAEDKMLECEFFLQLMSGEAHQDRFRWLLSAFLNSVYSFFETEAARAQQSYTNEDGESLWDIHALTVLQEYVDVKVTYSKKRKRDETKITARPKSVISQVLELRNSVTHDFPVSVHAEGATLPEDYWIGHIRGEGTPALALCRKAMALVRAAHNEIQA